jgi:hypothetical protein
MQDRPTAIELLAAVRRLLVDELVPALDGTSRFHARVAANVVGIVERELHEGEAQLREEWRRLAALLRPEGAVDGPPPEAAALAAAVAALTTELAGRVRAGDADGGPFRTAVLAHLRATTAEKLRIANPRYLEEDEP